MGSRKITKELVETIRSGEVAAGAYLPSMRELAGRYGVSLNTVHAAMKELEGLKLVECRPRRGAMVLEASAAAVVKSRRVVLTIPVNYDPQFESDWRTEWGGVIWHAIKKEMAQAGISTEYVPFKEEHEDCARWLERVGERPSGVLVWGHLVNAEFLEELDEQDIPWVSINRPGHDGNRNYVSADNQAGGRQVGRLFARLGWERILIVPNDVRFYESELEKTTGFFEEYLALGVSTAGIRVVRSEDTTELAGYRVVRKLWEEGERFDGIFATGDLLALGAIHALRDKGFDVPRDVGVVGATGLTRSAEFDPPLTVLRQPMEEMGRNAGQMLLQMMREGVRKFAPRHIPCELISRKSVSASGENYHIKTRGEVNAVKYQESNTSDGRP